MTFSLDLTTIPLPAVIPPRGSETFDVIYDRPMPGTDSTILTDFNVTNALEIARMDAGNAFFEGAIDEFRITNLTRSADWIAAQYQARTDSGREYFYQSLQSGYRLEDSGKVVQNWQWPEGFLSERERQWLDEHTQQFNWCKDDLHRYRHAWHPEDVHPIIFFT